MSASKKVLTALVLTVLVLAGGVFGLRSWLGTDTTEGGDQRAAGERVMPTRSPAAEPSVSVSPTHSASPSPSASPSVSPSPKASPTPSASPTPTRSTAPRPARPAPAAPRTVRSTAAVSAQVKAALDARGRPTVVSCPRSVPAAVGTRFSCAVAYAAQPSVVVADALVQITSADGTFSWRSVSRT
ncbi:MAG: hypothetical protein NTV28_13990 [Propionibacteriales bacterium]|nr:hypothetical protein [Propionibacteriales bacterium]